jgi:hypothetical protein
LILGKIDFGIDDHEGFAFIKIVGEAAKSLAAMTAKS